MKVAKMWRPTFWIPIKDGHRRRVAREQDVGRYVDARACAGCVSDECVQR